RKQSLKENYRGIHIALRTVAVEVRNVDGVAKPSQTIGQMPRNQFARKSDGTKFLSVVMLPQKPKLPADNVVVKTNVVRHKNGVFCKFSNFFGNLKKPWCIGNHFIVNAS